MFSRATLVRGRAAILAAAGDHPYVRLNAQDGDDPTGYLLDDAAFWTGTGPYGVTGWATGDAAQAVELAAELRAAGTFDPRWLHLPRLDADTLARHLPVTHRDDWDFRWAVAPPPVQPEEERVVRLGEADHDAIDALVDVAFPTSTTRPGDPRVHHWYGIHDGNRLVAAGADRSRGGTGFLAGITVATDSRGRGFGAALTAAMTRTLLDETEEVTLGVLTDNLPAIRLYDRLGFAGSIARTSVGLASVPVLA
ncbi:GNAT family N-acetyltransferase [Micromonospora sp. NPDC049523]|uniref:GNAT family N-acetyltransferase n=1 Tax=Micromonospora sp. NPDC049523 TaxID=3155921 RepID=UPI00341B1396